MGYNASFTGSIETKRISEQEKCSFLSIVNAAGFTAHKKWGEADIFEIDIDGYEIYNEDVFYDFLEKVMPYTKEGEIDFVGEDYKLWRFAFRDGKWYEDTGRIVYENSPLPISNAKENKK